MKMPHVIPAQAGIQLVIPDLIRNPRLHPGESPVKVFLNDSQ